MRRHQPATTTDSNDVLDEVRTSLAIAEDSMTRIADASRILDRALSRANGLLDAVRRTQAVEQRQQTELPPVKAETPGVRILRAPEVRKMSGLSRTTLWRLIP